MKPLYALLIPAALTVVGCASPVPVASNFPLSYQKLVRTAHHWDVVADDVVSQTVAAINANPALQGRALFVASSERRTAFNRAFREFLITRLVDRGASVSVCRSEPVKSTGFSADGPDVEVTYQTQIVGHGKDLPNYQPGRFTLLAGGVMVVRRLADLHLNTAESMATALTAGALADLGLGHVAAATRTEIIITTTIAENNRFVMRRSDIYYVPEGDTDLFHRWGGMTTSRCPTDDASPSDDMKDAMMESDREHRERVSEQARRDLVAREMRRTNPDWQAPPSMNKASAFSY